MGSVPGKPRTEGPSYSPIITRVNVSSINLDISNRKEKELTSPEKRKRFPEIFSRA
jgi:hypothetical protein